MSLETFTLAEKCDAQMRRRRRMRLQAGTAISVAKAAVWMPVHERASSTRSAPHCIPFPATQQAHTRMDCVRSSGERVSSSDFAFSRSMARKSWSSVKLFLLTCS